VFDVVAIFADWREASVQLSSIKRAARSARGCVARSNHIVKKALF
jgi:hypothetical protein